MCKRLNGPKAKVIVTNLTNNIALVILNACSIFTDNNYVECMKYVHANYCVLLC